MAKKQLADLDIIQQADPNKMLVLDTETTGLGPSAEILELCIYKPATDEVLFHKKFRPTWTDEWPHAEEIHGISPADVAEEDSLYEHMRDIRALIDGHTVLIYNKNYDTQLFPDSLHKAEQIGCIMNAYKVLTARTKFCKLTIAAEESNHDWSKGPQHSALGDCLASTSVLLNIFHILADARALI